MVRGMILPTGVGKLWLEADERALVRVCFLEAQAKLPEVLVGENALLRQARRQLLEYFAGDRCVFDLPLAFCGTPFQQRVWWALCTIPYGETRTYGQIAEQVGCRGGARAVGMANHRNPVGIVVPCHRVIGADGGLVGYAGGLGPKAFLLQLEQRNCK